MRHFVVLLPLVFGWAAMGEAQDQVVTMVRESRRSVDTGVGADRVGPPETNVVPNAAQGDSTPAGRKGFIIGLGGGVGFKRESITSGGSTFKSNQTGAITEFRIGYAPRDQVLVYYTNQVAWGENLNYDAIGMSAVGVSYMLKPTSPSAFVTGAVGASLGANIASGSSSTNAGLGLSFGGGYEFARHFSLSGRWMSLDVGYPNRSNVFGFTFDWLFY